MMTSVPPEILALPPAERMELAAQIWASIESSEIQLTDEHRRLLDERLLKYKSNPTQGRTWEEVKADLFKK